MAAKYKVGGECDSWCTKCKLMLKHVIIAIVDDLPKRVECNTCNGQHLYRPQPPGTKKATKAKKTKKKTTKKKKTRTRRKNDWATLVGERDTAEAHAYALDGEFEAEQLIDHPMFGIGWVREALPGDKIDVIFELGPKLLVHKRS